MDKTARNVLPRADSPPASFAPDRPELMNHLRDASVVEIERGVVFRPLVGAHNQARRLTTGTVTFEPGAKLSYHTHPFSEGVTLLEGQAAMEVQGRRYPLQPLDHVCIPRELPHCVLNLQDDRPAVFHIAMPTAEPTRTLVDGTVRVQMMPDGAAGPPDGERVRRHATTPAYELAPGTQFVDFFNRELGCPEMSGGYGLFAPGARLPCHLHDFDESICIIQGTATCVVEGRRYPLSDCSTALVPRGRCHYFINQSTQPMAMIWVYAGAMPERLVLDERWCDCGREA